MVDNYRNAQPGHGLNFATISKNSKTRVVYFQIDVEKLYRKYSSYES